jgi:hypothetical protein
VKIRQALNRMAVYNTIILKGASQMIFTIHCKFKILHNLKNLQIHVFPFNPVRYFGKDSAVFAGAAFLNPKSAFF